MLRGFLGIERAPLTERISERFDLAVSEGAIVMSRGADAAEARAGIQPGDIIVKVGDNDVRSVENLFASPRGNDPGDEVTLTVVRGDDRRNLTMRIDERPAN